MASINDIGRMSSNGPIGEYQSVDSSVFNPLESPSQIGGSQSVDSSAFNPLEAPSQINNLEDQSKLFVQNNEEGLKRLGIYDLVKHLKYPIA